MVCDAETLTKNSFAVYIFTVIVRHEGSLLLHPPPQDIYIMVNWVSAHVPAPTPDPVKPPTPPPEKPAPEPPNPTPQRPPLIDPEPVPPPAGDPPANPPIPQALTEDASGDRVYSDWAIAR